MKVKIKHILIENFCGIKKLDTELFDKTLISGSNGVGKSTIQNAIIWVLTNQMADGSSPDGKIRPHDKNGTDIDHVEIRIDLTVAFEDEEYILTKINKQKWTKSSTDQQKIMTGNVNEYLINGVPKIERDYKAFIEQFINMEEFKFCIGSKAFLKLNTAKRREKIMSLFGGEVSIEDIAEKNTNYTSLAKDLLVGTVEELIATCKKAIKKLKDKQDSIPIRIDELNNQMSEIDITALENKMSEIQDEIDSKVNEKAKILTSNEKVNNIASEIMQLKFEQGDIERELNVSRESSSREKRKLELEIDGVDSKISTLKSQRDFEQQIISSNESEMQDLREQIMAFENSKFDENSTICPTCKQPLPAEQIKQLKAEFEENKKKQIVRVNNKGVGLKKVNEQTEESIKETEEKIFKKLEEKKVLEEKLKEVIVPEAINVKSDSKWQKAQKKIEELEKQLKSIDKIDTKEIDLELSQLNKELIDVTNEIAIAKSKNFEDRIAELKAEAIEVEQKIADEEKKKKLLEDYNKDRIEMLTAPVNSHFKVVKFKLFKPLIKDKTSFEDVCEILVNGTSYDANLNVGFKILADVDLCQAFQKAYGIVAPIFIDNSESLDEARVPETEGQLILMKRTDETALNIKEK